MATKAEQLRERLATELANIATIFNDMQINASDIDTDEVAGIFRAIVQELGITEEMVEVLRELHRYRAHLDQIQGYMQHVSGAADAISHILEASK